MNTAKTAALPLPADLVSEIEHEAKRARKSVARVIAEAVADWVDSRDAATAYKRHLASGGKTYSLDEVEKRHALAR